MQREFGETLVASFAGQHLTPRTVWARQCQHSGRATAALEVSPRTVGQPLRASHPDGLHATDVAEAGLLLVFGVIEGDRRVDLLHLTVSWQASSDHGGPQAEGQVRAQAEQNAAR